MSLPLAAKGEFAHVKSNLETALDKSGQPVRRGTMAHDHHVYMLLAEAAAQQRDPAGLAAYVPPLAALAERDGHRLYQGIAARAQAVAHHLAGDDAAAAAAFDHALALFEALGTPWQLGRTLAERAALAQTAGDAAAARHDLTRAQAAFELLHALPDLERIQAALSGLPA
jgi:hypothetical protein